MKQRDFLYLSACIAGLLSLLLLILLYPSDRAQAQNAMSPKPPYSNFWRITPSALTTTSAVNLCNLAGGPPCGKDVVVCQMDFSTKGTASAFSVYDIQSTPVPLADVVAIAAHTTYSQLVVSPGDQSCRFFPGGVTVTAQDANAIWFSATGKY